MELCFILARNRVGSVFPDRKPGQTVTVSFDVRIVTLFTQWRRRNLAKQNIGAANRL